MHTHELYSKYKVSRWGMLVNDQNQNDEDVINLRSLSDCQRSENPIPYIILVLKLLCITKSESSYTRKATFFYKAINEN